MTLKIGLRTGRRLTGAAAAVLLSAGLLGAGALGAGVASASTVGTVAGQQFTAPAVAVPWGSVGTGWVLTVYSTATVSKPEPTTLYLVSPSGAKYAIDTWKAAGRLPLVIAWAGNKTQALLSVPVPKASATAVAELNLETGKLTALTLAGNADPLGYTLPTGQQILGETANPDGNAHAKITLARYTQAGKLVKALITEKGYGISALYAPNGAALALAAPAAVSLLSNAGGTPKKLPVPGVSTSSDCSPVRWWNASTVLAACEPKNDLDIPQLWLVPASGARASALTPVRKAGADLGDIDAWQLSSGLYLQSLGACGSLEINKQASNGSITPVTVPGTNQSPIVVTATSSRLLVRTGGCFNGGELVWFNPATRAEQWFFKTGVQQVVAYTNEENA